MTIPPSWGDASNSERRGSKGRRFGPAVSVTVAAGALLAGVGVGAFALNSGGGAPTASPSADVPTASPIVFVETVRLTIPEGFTAAQIYERGSEVLGIPVADFEEAATHPELIGLPPEAEGNVEGWLGAFTYQIPENATAEEVLAALIEATLYHLDLRGIPEADRLEVLTKASLIEKEVRLDRDRPMVARVIENRLDAGMMLQFDSTVHYVVGADSVFTSDEDRSVDSPYNTYRYTGLPPGPICSPGVPSLEAALAPVAGSWLYFVAINLDTGETVFATTYEDHLANVAILQDWIAANR